MSGIPNVQGPKPGEQGSIYTRILVDAEARASAGPEGAAGVWADKRTLAAVVEGLKRPSSGSAYTAWAGSAELRQAARVAARLLRFSAARPEAAADLQRATAAAAQVPRVPSKLLVPLLLDLTPSKNPGSQILVCSAYLPPVLLKYKTCVCLDAPCFHPC